MSVVENSNQNMRTTTVERTSMSRSSYKEMNSKKLKEREKDILNSTMKTIDNRIDILEGEAKNKKPFAETKQNESKAVLQNAQVSQIVKEILVYVESLKNMLCLITEVKFIVNTSSIALGIRKKLEEIIAEVSPQMKRRRNTQLEHHTPNPEQLEKYSISFEILKYIVLSISILEKLQIILDEGQIQTDELVQIGYNILKVRHQLELTGETFDLKELKEEKGEIEKVASIYQKSKFLNKILLNSVPSLLEKLIAWKTFFLSNENMNSISASKLQMRLQVTRTIVAVSFPLISDLFLNTH